MRLFLSFCLVIFLAPVLWGKDDPLNFSKEYIQRIFSGEKLFLWNLEPRLGDEKGYRSLFFKSEFSGDDVQIFEDRIHGLVISSEDSSYKMIPYNVCATISRAGKDFHNIFGAQIRCVSDLRGSYPYLLVVGENNNEILKEQIEKGSTDRILIPSWYDYQVIEKTKSPDR